VRQRSSLMAEIRRRLRYSLKLIWRSAVSPLEGVSRKPELVSAEDLGITFIGHSSFLLQLAGMHVLCDPVFARWLVLLRRQRRPGVKIKHLPATDLVLLSHAHMDHLNRPSLRRIVRRSIRLTGRAPVAVVPWDVSELIADLGFRRVIELRWWESATVGRLRITLTPAKHWGTRWFHDGHRGYGGYVLEGGAQRLYYSGDTAYFGGFREIGARLQPQIALLPIGAYTPDSYRTVHTSPEDALQALADVGARWMVPMHYGTFWLGEEPMEEPVPRLLASAERMGLRDRVRVVEEGETLVFPTGNGAKPKEPKLQQEAVRAPANPLPAT
jgi:L-ascorbate metabolism protein UlaG (beta-lactamase superfamily)